MAKSMFSADFANKLWTLNFELISQWSFKRFHFRYKHLKVLTEVAFVTCRGREFQMAAPEYMNILRKSSQLGLQLRFPFLISEYN